MKLSEKIHNEGLDIGYTRMGAIHLESLEEHKILKQLQSTYPWAKSMIIGAYHYNFYKIPKGLENISKEQLFQGRYIEGVEENDIAKDFEAFLKESQVKFEDVMKIDRLLKYQLAEEMHIGIVRKNSYFYTDEGSYCSLHAWLTDQELEWLLTEPPTPCPGHCSRCIRTCPEKALIKGYVKDKDKCIALDIQDYINYNSEQAWLKGCNHCQDICPYNRDRWEEAEEFPGLNY